MIISMPRMCQDREAEIEYMTRSLLEKNPKVEGQGVGRIMFMCSGIVNTIIPQLRPSKMKQK